MIVALDVVLREREGGRAVARAPLPAHARERLVADAALSASLAGVLPPDGEPVSRVAFTLESLGADEALAVEIDREGVRFRKRFARDAVADDARALVSQLCESGQLAGGPYDFDLVRRDGANAVPAPLHVRPRPRRLPRLAVCAPADFGLQDLPPCAHPWVGLPRSLAGSLLARASATPDVEVGAALVVEPALLTDGSKRRLALRVHACVPLEHGTCGDDRQLVVSPEALAHVACIDGAGLHRGGLAHSHPRADGAPALFLSSRDVWMATHFFGSPWAIQIVIDPGAGVPEQALAVFAWCDARLARVCFSLVPD
jgi:hypothetical protein